VNIKTIEAIGTNQITERTVRIRRRTTRKDPVAVTVIVSLRKTRSGLGHGRVRKNVTNTKGSHTKSMKGTKTICFTRMKRNRGSPSSRSRRK